MNGLRARAFLPFGALLAVLLASYWSTFQGMVEIWMRSETFAHAFVVPPIVIWLVWRRREYLVLCAPRTEAWLILPMLLIASLWLFGNLVAANSVTQLSATAALVLAVPLTFGLRTARIILFPLAFAFFAVPIGEALTPILMRWTADFTVSALRVSGIPVYREGQQFVIPSGRWSVVEACSGIRYLMASFMVGSLFAYLNYRSALRRWVFVVFSIVLPIVANWVRAYIIVVLGHISNNEIATGADHLVYGWVFFGIVISTMFFIGVRWAEPEKVSSYSDTQGLTEAPDPKRTWGIIFIAALVVASPHLALKQLEAPVFDGVPDLVLDSTLAPGWSADSSPLPFEWKPVFVGASVERSQVYVGPNGAVGVYIAYYRWQREGRKLVSSSNVLVASQDYRWNQLSSGVENISIEGKQLDFQSAELLAAEHSGHLGRPLLVVWKYYWVGGHLTSSDIVAKAVGGWRRLIGQGDDSASVLIYTTENNKGSARLLLREFVNHNSELISKRLKAACTDCL